MNNMNRKESGYRNIVFLSQLSINVMVPTFLCLFIGIWIDGKFNTFFTIPFLVLGILAGGRNAYMVAMKTVKDEERVRKKKIEEEIQSTIERANGDKEHE